MSRSPTATVTAVTSTRTNGFRIDPKEPQQEGASSEEPELEPEPTQTVEPKLDRSRTGRLPGAKNLPPLALSAHSPKNETRSKYWPRTSSSEVLRQIPA